MANWYYAVGSQTEGPVAEGELARMAREGRLSPTSYVVREGESTWQSLGEVENALGLVRNASGTYSAPSPSDAPAAAPGAAGWAGPGGASSTPGAGEQTGWGAAGSQPQYQPTQPGWGAPPGGQQPSWGQPSQPSPPGGGTSPWDAPPAGGGWTSDYGQAYTGPQPGPGAPGGGTYAEWWQRLLAKLIDFFILLVPSIILVAAFAWDDIQDALDDDDSGFQVTFGASVFVAQLVGNVIAYAYYAYLNGRGQTVGKLVLGIKTVDLSTGQPIGTGKGFVRHVGQFVISVASAVPFVSCIYFIAILVDSLWPLWDDRKQAIHDKLGGSTVVRAH